MGSSKCRQVAATVHLGMFLITRVVIPEEHSCLETGKGPPQGHGDLFGDKTSMSRHSRTLLRHFSAGIAEGQESPTAGIGGGGMRSWCWSWGHRRKGQQSSRCC